MTWWISNWQTEKKESDVIRIVMEDAFKAGFNAKEIAGYFVVNISWVYKNISVKDLKKEMKGL